VWSETSQFEVLQPAILAIKAAPSAVRGLFAGYDSSAIVLDAEVVRGGRRSYAYDGEEEDDDDDEEEEDDDNDDDEEEDYQDSEK
jgi:hypothetical protein